VPVYRLIEALETPVKDPFTTDAYPVGGQVEAAPKSKQL
jgi:hypothetical protein